MTFANNISTEEVLKMPREVFSGRIVVVNAMESLSTALTYLSSCQSIGFDTETRPNFTKDSHNKMSLMQLSCDDTCFLIRLNKFKKMPHILEAFLKNPIVTKIGLSLRDDFHGLRSLTNISPDSFIDLQTYVKQFGIEEMSLRKIYAILFGKRISKSQQKSNWDAEYLTESQKRYAALDAWSCLRIYQYLDIHNETLQHIS